MTPLDDRARDPRVRKRQDSAFSYLRYNFQRLKLSGAPYDQYAWMLAIALVQQGLPSPKKVTNAHLDAAYAAIAPELDTSQKAQFHHGLEVVRALRNGRHPPRTPELPMLCPACQEYARLIPKPNFLAQCPETRIPRERGDAGRWTYVCRNAPECCAFVGTHGGDLYPLGTLADAELGPMRGAARRKMNELFNRCGWDRGWQDTFIQEVLDLGPFSGHIDMLPKDWALALERAVEQWGWLMLGIDLNDERRTIEAS